MKPQRVIAAPSLAPRPPSRTSGSGSQGRQDGLRQEIPLHEWCRAGIAGSAAKVIPCDRDGAFGRARRAQPAPGARARPAHDHPAHRARAVLSRAGGAARHHAARDAALARRASDGPRPDAAAGGAVDRARLSRGRPAAGPLLRAGDGALVRRARRDRRRHRPDGHDQHQRLHRLLRRHRGDPVAAAAREHRDLRARRGRDGGEPGDLPALGAGAAHQLSDERDGGVGRASPSPGCSTTGGGASWSSVPPSIASATS